MQLFTTGVLMKLAALLRKIKLELDELSLQALKKLDPNNSGRVKVDLSPTSAFIAELTHLIQLRLKENYYDLSNLTVGDTELEALLNSSQRLSAVVKYINLINTVPLYMGTYTTDVVCPAFPESFLSAMNRGHKGYSDLDEDRPICKVGFN